MLLISARACQQPGFDRAALHLHEFQWAGLEIAALG
jgi:hypothetical protein